MNVTTKSLIAAMVFGGSVTIATAAPVITDVTASGTGLGSFSLNNINESMGLVDFSSRFASASAITYTFTVGHSDNGFSSYNVVEDIKNGTNTLFTGLHLQLVGPENAPANGIVFTSYDASDEDMGPEFSPEFTLDSPSLSQPAPFEPTGSQSLNFTGNLAAGATTESGYFNLSVFDPGVGNSYTFSLTQTPVAAVVPEPETYAMFLAGLGLMGFMARRRQKQSA
jgi:hypothetical protein